jgi:RNA recognition motif-containing protein
MIENVENYKNIFTDENLLKSNIEEFNTDLRTNENNYIVKDKTDRIDCCQALKKKERAKKIKSDYEKVKKQIKEKYKFCNLYIKNLPDSFDDETLRKIFAEFGEIRSCKTVRKELFTSYLGIKRSVKIFGFVCFFDKEQARNAKIALNGKQAGNSNTNTGVKLYVDYHQNKAERNEFLKLRFMNLSNKNQNLNQNQNQGQKGMMRMDMRMPTGGKLYPGMLPPNMMQFGPGPAGIGMMMNRNMPNMNMMHPQMINPSMNMNMPVDKNTRRDYFGDRLFSKISSMRQFSNMTEYFSKIVGIFLELDDNIIEKLIMDEAFLVSQVNETHNVNLIIKL